MAHSTNENPVEWPARAVVTAGMPYGNKPLHFGHVGGVFVPADAFARFLRDRIGKDNVRFVSGTDCFGSPINEGYRKLVEAGEFDGSISDYVMRNHERQANTLRSYGISLSIYDGSGIGHAGEVHQHVSEAFIEKLHENGFLRKESTLQFYDTEAQTFLNGRQVVGHCPVQGCKSEHAYADECDLGHQYDPIDLIAPKSSVTGTVPEMRPVENWYFDLPAFSEFLKKHVEAQGYEFYVISAATTQGTRELMKTIAGKLAALPPVTIYEPEYVKPLAEAGDADELQIERYDDLWVVSGKWLQKLLNDINFDDYESRMYFDRQLRKSGLFDRLEEQGIEDGDTVSIYDFEFDYTK